MRESKDTLGAAHVPYSDGLVGTAAGESCPDDAVPGKTQDGVTVTFTRITTGTTITSSLPMTKKH